MRKFAKWGAALLALLCAFGLGRSGNAYSETDLALAREDAYNSGYHAGFAQGEASRQESLYTEAFSAGRLQGYDEGLAEGLRRIPEPVPTEPAAVSPSLPVFTPLPVDTPAPDRSAPASDETTEQVVYVTKSGTKYHRGSCSHLSKSRIEKSLAEAKAQNYEPCKTCSPPK